MSAISACFSLVEACSRLLEDWLSWVVGLLELVGVLFELGMIWRSGLVLVVLVSLDPVVFLVNDIAIYCKPALGQWLQRVVTLRCEGWCVVLL